MPQIQYESSQRPGYGPWSFIAMEITVMRSECSSIAGSEVFQCFSCLCVDVLFSSTSFLKKTLWSSSSSGVLNLQLRITSYWIVWEAISWLNVFLVHLNNYFTQNEAYSTEKSRNIPSQNMSQLFGKEVEKLNFVTSVWHQPGHFDHSLTPYRMIALSIYFL